MAESTRAGTARAVAVMFLSLLLVAAAAAAGVPIQSATGLPRDVPVILVGDPWLEVGAVRPWKAVFSIGGLRKEGPMAVGQRIEVAALQTLELRRAREDGLEYWERTFSTRRAGQDQVVAHGAIRLDPATLAPIWSRVESPAGVTETEYDWSGFVIRQTTDAAGETTTGEETLDLKMLEAAAHDVWMGAIPHDRQARVPSILAGGGGKYWMVPRVVGTEPFDIGDGVERQARVIALDWWGMGKDHASFFPGLGRDGNAGSGGTYWVLESPPAGVPPVVRIRTEADENTDRVNQLQDGPAS